MSADETRTRAGGGRTARSFTAREDLVQALVSLGVTRNAATRVFNPFVVVSEINSGAENHSVVVYLGLSWDVPRSSHTIPIYIRCSLSEFKSVKKCMQCHRESFHQFSPP